MKDKSCLILILILCLSLILGGTATLFDEQNSKNSMNVETYLSESGSCSSSWYRTWGGSSTEEGNGVAVDSLDNIYLVGSTGDDIVLAKYDSSGILQWNRTWDASSDDDGNGVALDSVGNIYVVGSTGINGNDMVLVKYNNSGVQQWNRTWGESLGDSGNGVAIDSLNNVYITGTTGIGADVVLVKYNSSGVQQWNRTWSEGIDSAYGVAVDSSDNIYLVGEALIGNNHILLVKYNSSGVLQWDRKLDYSLGYAVGYAITVDSFDNIYLAGETLTRVSGERDMVLVKFDSSGAFKWSRKWGETYLDERAYGVTVDSSNNVYLVGYEGVINKNINLIKYNSSGVQQWVHTWGGVSDDVGNGVIVDSTDDVYLVGSTSSLGAGSLDIVLIKYSFPEIIVNTPNQNEIYGTLAPNFDISIFGSNINTTWYSLDGGTTIFPFIGLNGGVDQTEWANQGSGTVTISFFVNNTLGKVGCTEVSVVKDIPLAITDTQSDFSIESGYTGVNISWTAVDSNPSTYTIDFQGNDTVAGPHAWSSGIPIIYNVPDDLTVGLYSFTINFTDNDGNFVADTVNITVTDTTNPILLNAPNNFSLHPDYTGVNISWTAADQTPNTYTIALQGTGIVFGPNPWSSSIEISYDVPDGLAVGNYTYTINFTDYYDNFVTDTVTMTVQEVENNSAISFGNYYLIFLFIGIISLAVIQKRRRFSFKN